MVPTLKLDRDKLKEFGFFNAYIKDIKRDIQYENAVYMLFKPPNIETFMRFINKEYEKSNSILLEDYAYEGGIIILVYSLNEEFKDDFEIVKQGKYSKTSEKFKELFPRVLKIMKNNLHRDEISLQYRIFNKTDDLIEYWERRLAIDFTNDMEVWEGWDEKNETLDIDKIKPLI